MSDTPSWPTGEGDGTTEPTAAPPPATPEAPTTPPPAPTPPAAAPTPPPAPPAAAPPPAPEAVSPPPAPASPAPPAAPAQSGSQLLGLRIGARVIDGAITGIAGFVIGLTLALRGDATLLAAVITTVLTLGYFVAFEVTQGATPGKMLVGLRVTDEQGATPDVETSLKRNAWLALQFVPFLGAIAVLAAAIYIAVTINTDPEGRGFHDRFAGSVVRRK